MLAAALMSGCAADPAAPAGAAASPAVSRQALQWLDRITWGADTASARELAALGQDRYLERQLHPLVASPDARPPAGAPPVAAPTRAAAVMQLEAQRRDADATTEDEPKKAARQRYQRALTRVANESASRSLLRDLHSPNQLQEQMTWFWFNHFNVFQYKRDLRAMVGDFEDTAIRPHALGRFRDLLLATMRHPAMLRYLDNEQNAVGRINENYARELMELHTLGVDGGYSQRDVQELARVLTGLGVNLTDRVPNVRATLKAQYVRDGLFEFNPTRHDFGDKELLGHVIRGRGLGEIEDVADLLSRQPATARFVSRKLAIYFVADDPPAALVERMAATFQGTDGDIAATLRTLFRSPELTASLGSKFKDPVHYVVSAVRVAYDGRTITNPAPMINWLNRLGAPLYGRLTPDGYPLTRAAWASAGQLAARFEIAKIIGSSNAGLFRIGADDPALPVETPQPGSSLYYEHAAHTLAPATEQALEAARSPQEWNTFLLASPEFMFR